MPKKKTLLPDVVEKAINPPEKKPEQFGGGTGGGKGAGAGDKSKQIIPPEVSIPAGITFTPEGIGGGIKTIRQPSGEVYFENLKTSAFQQQTGQTGAGAPTPEQQAAINQNNLRQSIINTQEARQGLGQPTAEQRTQAAQQNKMTSLTRGALPETLAEAGTGAIAGAIVGGPVGAIAGGVLGAVRGFYVNLKQEAKQDVREQNAEYLKGKNLIKATMNAWNKGILTDPIEARNSFNLGLAEIDQAERNLKMLAEKDWLTKSQDDLTAIESFNQMERTNMIILFENSLITPNPALNFELDNSISEAETSSGGFFG